MRISAKNLFTTLILIALPLASLACNAAAFSRVGAPAPAQDVQPSADALASFNSKWRNLNLATPSGPFSITFTEAELTSAANAAIAQTEADSGQAIPIDNVQVHLRPEAIDVFGQVQLDPLTVNGLITFVPSIGADGRIHLEIAEVEFGPLDVDETLLDEIVASVEHSINEPIQASPSKITLTSLVIDQNLLTISGTISQ